MRRCPCSVDDEDHQAVGASQQEQQSLLFAYELLEDDYAPVLGHTVVATRDTGAYVWCDQYLFSPNFSLGVGLPPCPAGSLAFERSAVFSTTLCEFCRLNGCVMEREARSTYGKKSLQERQEHHAWKAMSMASRGIGKTIAAKVPIASPPLRKLWKEKASNAAAVIGTPEGGTKSPLSQLGVQRIKRNKTTRGEMTIFTKKGRSGMSVGSNEGCLASDTEGDETEVELWTKKGSKKYLSRKYKATESKGSQDIGRGCDMEGENKKTRARAKNRFIPSADTDESSTETDLQKEKKGDKATGRKKKSKAEIGRGADIDTNVMGKQEGPRAKDCDCSSDTECDCSSDTEWSCTDTESTKKKEGMN